jgi:hypothetical protein
MQEDRVPSRGEHMSAKNGDKAQFHRVRKQNIRRRERNRKFREALARPESGSSTTPERKSSTQ